MRESTHGRGGRRESYVLVVVVKAVAAWFLVRGRAKQMEIKPSEWMQTEGKETGGMAPGSYRG